MHLPTSSTAQATRLSLGRLACWWALLLVACGDGSGVAEESDTQPAQMTAEAPEREESICGDRGVELDALSVTGDSGAELRVVEYQPERLVVGDQSWVVALSLDGEPLSGLEEQLQVTPFMPDHGHGTAVATEVDELDDGEYRLSPVNLRMPGYWSITVEMTAELDSGDVMTESFEFGVCVQ